MSEKASFFAEFILSEAKNLAPGPMPGYYVYFLTNRSGTLCIGVANDLERRVYERKNKLVHGFTKRYDLTRLVYYETADDARSAIQREKQIKGRLRRKKIESIRTMNPRWLDLAERWHEGGQTLRGVYAERTRRAQGDERLARSAGARV